jgi:hypothetical protein
LFLCIPFRDCAACVCQHNPSQSQPCHCEGSSSWLDEVSPIWAFNSEVGRDSRVLFPRYSSHTW